ncbi:MAG: lipase family alpha/beta hydrolase, partial [Actinomycetota bacterium]
NFGWNLWRGLLSERSAVCTIDLPNAALTDIQIGAEWVALASQIIYEGTGEDVDIIGHSQGGLVPRWAIKYFSPGRFEVDDYIGLASPNHGTLVADSFVFGCFESCWQMKTTSMFLEALNSGDETPFATDYTSIYSASDELVQPIGTQDLDGGTNILLQDICPGRPVDHVGIAADNLTWRLILDALKNEGAADPSSLPDDICTTGQMPGTTYPDPAHFPPNWGDGHFTDREPELKPYAR